MRTGAGFSIRPATNGDIPGARALMIRILEEDFRTDYLPEFHRDVADIAGVYLAPPRHTLFVAVDDATGELVATGGVRGGSLRHGPPELAERYDDEHTAQLVRIYVRREDRRRGVARALVQVILEFILADDTYRTIALHTFPHSPGALAFWESIGTKVAEYEREGQFPQVFFEISREQAEAIVGQPAGRPSQ